MRLILTALVLISISGLAYAADDGAACQARQAQVATRVEAFKGDTMVRRIMLADLDRAERELAEGDPDECMEALDHTEKLLKENH